MWNVDLTLPGQKATLRAIREEDAPLVVRWRNMPAVRHNLYSQAELTVEQHLAWHRGKVLTGNCAQFIIEDVQAGVPVGTTFLKNIDPYSRKAEFGIFIGEDVARGKGLGSEAARLILGYGFGVLNLNRIYLTVFSDNRAAVKSYQNAGFTVEGELRQDFLRDGVFEDVTLMSILRGEWQA